MKQSISFQVGRKILKVLRWVRNRQRIRRSKPKIKFPKWGSALHHRVKVLCSANIGPRYVRLCQEECKAAVKATVPKGHLAVYVGESKHERNRVTIPVKYFNHPLFNALLEETEREFGHAHIGRIQIPCPFYIFENVKKRIATATATH